MSTKNACDIEATRDEALEKLLDAPEYSDVVLRGNDGVYVPAIRSLLSARSEVFEKMLYGNFAEAQKEVVGLPFSGCVLKSLVEYIYMDKVTSISELPHSGFILKSLEEFVFVDKSKMISEAMELEQKIFGATIVGLIEAGTYFALPKLVTKAKQAAEFVMKNRPNFAYICLSTCDSPSVSQSFVLAFIRKHPDSVLSDNHAFVGSLDESKLALILNDPEMCMAELSRFKLIQTWVQSDGDEERELQAKAFANHLHLQHINPTDLSTIVAHSGLVSDHRMLQAFQAHALLAERRFGMIYGLTRNPLWKGKSGHYHKLKCLPLSTGKHTWQLRVSRPHTNTGVLWVGVASSVRGVNSKTSIESIDGNTAFMYGNTAFMYGSDGMLLSKGLVSPSAHPVFQGRITITLSLDLTGRGTLSASLDNGKTSFELFNDMRDAYDGDDDVGFVPAVYVGKRDKVRFVGFCKDDDSEEPTKAR